MKDFTINSSDSLLLIIDIQDRLFNAMESGVQSVLKKNGTILINTAREFNIPLIFTEQYRKGLGETIPELKDLAGDSLNLEKLHFDCMKDDEIKKAVLKAGKKTVIITGIESHICVLQTALSLISSGIKVIVAADGVASRKKEDWKSALSILSEAGALVYPTETIAFMIIEKAGTPEFKKLSPLFK
ncbi:MAG TPA: hydrolase [Spirochaetota bacterium]|nr:hydrolase [Spirochaetota bacterium]HPS85724.1 hydrolase [Spirochaetota bacterium]